MKRVWGLGFCLFLASCAADLSDRARVELAHQRDAPVDEFGKILVANPAREREFQRFWKSFRSCVLRSDWQGLRQHTRFPLQMRGSLDYDPVIEVSSEGFPKVFGEFLRAERQLIEELREPQPYIVDDWVRVGDMQFTRTDRGWKLYWIYFE